MITKKLRKKVNILEKEKNKNNIQILQKKNFVKKMSQMNNSLKITGRDVTKNKKNFIVLI